MHLSDSLRPPRRVFTTSIVYLHGVLFRLRKCVSRGDADTTMPVPAGRCGSLTPSRACVGRRSINVSDQTPRQSVDTKPHPFKTSSPSPLHPVTMASYLGRAAPRAFNASLRATARPALRSSVNVQRPAAPLFRRFLQVPAEQPRLRLGSLGTERYTPAQLR